MRVAGIDIGSLSSKSVILEDGHISSWSIHPTGPDSTKSAYEVMKRSLEAEGLHMSALECVVGTGYGRINVPFAHATVTEISCHAKGSHYLFPGVRTILDMGGQDCKAINCDESGRLINFVMNDKCAAGTGRYLERIAKILGIPLSEIGERSFDIVDAPATIRSFCTVFAENDVHHLLRQGVHVNDILAGACEAITRRVRNLLDKVEVREEFSISGGIAKNIGVVKRLERDLQTIARIAPEPQIVGALGAALFAQERATGLPMR